MNRRNTTWLAQFKGKNVPSEPQTLTTRQAQLSSEPRNPERYMPFLQVELDGQTIFAEGPSGDVVTIKKFEKYHIGVIEYLKKCSHENIVTTLKYKIVSSQRHFFQESIMTYTLRQVITVPRAFTDRQIATVCREVHLRFKSQLQSW
jgi:hypothetical protein